MSRAFRVVHLPSRTPYLRKIVSDDFTVLNGVNVGHGVVPGAVSAAWLLDRRPRVREARLHDARHTAATVLLLGVPERAVMDVMGWSNSAMVKRYAHVTARLRRDIADRLDKHPWKGK